MHWVILFHLLAISKIFPVVCFRMLCTATGRKYNWIYWFSQSFLLKPDETSVRNNWVKGQAWVGLCTFCVQILPEAVRNKTYLTLFIRLNLYSIICAMSLITTTCIVGCLFCTSVCWNAMCGMTSVMKHVSVLSLYLVKTPEPHINC